MKKGRVVFLTCLFAWTSAFAALVTVVPPAEGAYCTNRILFLMDASGSMQGESYEEACRSMRWISSQPIDEMRFAVTTFSNENHRWEGVPEPDSVDPIPEHWAGLPSATAVDQAQAWLAEQAEGTTRVIPGLQSALRERVENMTIVLLTDGRFDESDEDVLEAIETYQQWRADECLTEECTAKQHDSCKKLGRALIIVYGIGAEQEILKEIGKAGQGGYFRNEPETTPTPH